MMRGLFYWVGGAIFTVLMAIVFYLSLPFFRVKPDLPHRIIKFWSRILLTLFCGVKVDLSGAGRIDPRGSYVIVSNHRSYMDILVAHTAFPLHFVWFAKSSLFRIPVFGLAMRITGYIPVERERSHSASRSLGIAERTLRTGRSVWIFPEGTRTPASELGKFKRGAFVLADRTGLPILPVVLSGTDGIFRSPLIIAPKAVKVVVCAPVDGAAPAGSGSMSGARYGSDSDSMRRAAKGARSNAVPAAAYGGRALHGAALQAVVDKVRRIIKEEYDRADAS